jgi:hypothetical protein
VPEGGFDPERRLMGRAGFFVRFMRACGASFIHRIALHYGIGNPSLAHSPSPPSDRGTSSALVAGSFRIRCRAEQGALEFRALPAFSRSLVRMT